MRGWRWRCALTAALLVAAGCTPDGPAGGVSPDEPALPASMAALGDSITRAVAACEFVLDCPETSWSTGSLDGLHSHAQRIQEAGGQRPEVHNLAVSGARVSDLHTQAQQAVTANADYVTVLIGANDSCTGTESTMTPIAQFEATFAQAIDTLVHGLPRAHILVLSIPDISRLWRVGKDRTDVRETWRRLGTCQSMLANPTSTSATAEERRRRVRDQVVAYNQAMEEACARHATCRWDENAVFDHDFTLESVSARDYFHPSLAGQQVLAEISWNAGYWPQRGGLRGDPESDRAKLRAASAARGIRHPDLPGLSRSADRAGHREDVPG
jgi:lysophospholipase L1-like esterase